MIGMFQSSRTASGNPCLQTSSAFSPSSASMIWKSSPSRMRRATFRMTLESSTTRHVFILASTSFQDPKRVVSITDRMHRALRGLCGQLVGCDFKDAVDVEHDHQLSVEAVNAGGHLGHARVEIYRVDLAAFVRELQNLADRIDQQPV